MARIGRGRQGLVYPPALDRGGAVVDRRADQRVPEPDIGSYDDQVLGLGRRGGFRSVSEAVTGAPQQGGVAGRVGGSGQQQRLRAGRKVTGLTQEPGLQLAAERQQFGQRCLAGQLAGRQLPPDLDQSQRVALSLGDVRCRPRSSIPGSATDSSWRASGAGSPVSWMPGRSARPAGGGPRGRAGRTGGRWRRPAGGGRRRPARQRIRGPATARRRPRTAARGGRMRAGSASRARSGTGRAGRGNPGER